jgi:hypothetical protein
MVAGVAFGVPQEENLKIFLKRANFSRVVDAI